MTYAKNRLWKGKDQMPLDLALLVGSAKEREEEARRQGVLVGWETRLRWETETRGHWNWER